MLTYYKDIIQEPQVRRGGPRRMPSMPIGTASTHASSGPAGESTHPALLLVATVSSAFSSNFDRQHILTTTPKRRRSVPCGMTPFAMKGCPSTKRGFSSRHAVGTPCPFGGLQHSRRSNLECFALPPQGMLIAVHIVNRLQANVARAVHLKIVLHVASRN